MSSTLKKHAWLFVCLFLLITIIAGATIWFRFPRSPTVEIYPPPGETKGFDTVIIYGAINIPGIYTFKPDDTIDSLLQAAGGPLNDADIKDLKLYVPCVDESPGEQKIDLNSAGSWLLEALPGIGKTLSDRIVDYRNENGPFRNISELTKVKGITSSIYEKIKDFITVTD